jgi:transmembrane 9 superfamily protein 2/4
VVLPFSFGVAWVCCAAEQGLVAMILVRALYRDFSRYNRVATDEEKAEDKEETGWKLVHADVYRPPKNPMLFSVVVGVGSQVTGMALVTILFAAAGFLSPANRGSLMTSMLLVFLFMGAGAGYVAARTHKVNPHACAWVCAAPCCAVLCLCCALRGRCTGV